MTRARLGQHFLADPAWRARIARSLGLDRESPDASTSRIWLEIGAGHGEMTRELARTASRVVAVELDLRLAATLRELARELPIVEVVEGDVLELDLARVVRAHRYRVYGNLPYYITAPILRRLFEQVDHIESIHIVVQFDVAARLTARPGRREYGYLSAMAQFYARPEIELRIPPGAFRPRPKVTSALVTLRLPGERAQLQVVDEGEFLGFVARCFEHKRKTLLNNLKSRFPAARVSDALHSLGLPGEIRAEQMSLSQFALLERCLRTG